ncbi:MAG: hypothetical protein HQL79_10960 [Magnetococcales bacterium]|nr:hypothetical protein [Magnetococcales bacterium]
MDDLKERSRYLYVKNKINKYNNNDLDKIWQIEQLANMIPLFLFQDGLNDDDNEHVKKILNSLKQFNNKIHSEGLQYQSTIYILLNIENNVSKLSSDGIKNEAINIINNIRRIIAKSGISNQNRIKYLLNINTYDKYTGSSYLFVNNDHAEVSSDVNFRLNLRHAVLVQTMKQIESIWKGSQSFFPIKSHSETVPELNTQNTHSKCYKVNEITKDVKSVFGQEIPPKTTNFEYNTRHAYHLAVTDLFVEKAIAYLEKHANKYKKFGIALNLLALTIVSGGMFFSIYLFLESSDNITKKHKDYVTMMVCIYKGDEYIDAKDSKPSRCQKMENKVNQEKTSQISNIDKNEDNKIVRENNIFVGVTKDDKNKEDSNDLAFVRSQIWIDLIASFIRGFTMYGMIVLVSVGMWRFGRAMLDQAERLFEKRHALRQGRLFVHLNDGELSIEQMKEAFNWNLSFSNAFGEMPTDASAPWGNVINELVKIIPEIVKSNLESSKDKSKGDDGKKK